MSVRITQAYQSTFDPWPPRQFVAPLNQNFVRWLQDNFELVQTLCEFVTVQSRAPVSGTAGDPAQIGALWIDNTAGHWYRQSSTTPTNPSWVQTF